MPTTTNDEHDDHHSSALQINDDNPGRDDADIEVDDGDSKDDSKRPVKEDNQQVKKDDNKEDAINQKNDEDNHENISRYDDNHSQEMMVLGSLQKGSITIDNHLQKTSKDKQSPLPKRKQKRPKRTTSEKNRRKEKKNKDKTEVKQYRQEKVDKMIGQKFGTFSEIQSPVKESKDEKKTGRLKEERTKEARVCQESMEELMFDRGESTRRSIIYCSAQD